MNSENTPRQNRNLAESNINGLYAVMGRKENMSEKAYKEFKRMPMALRHRCKYENKVCSSECKDVNTCIHGKGETK